MAGKLIGVVALGLALPVAVIGPADAGVSGSMSAPNGVLYSGCRYLPVSYSLAVTPDVDSWSVDLSLIGPDGLEASSAFFYDDEGGPKGIEGIQFCSYFGPGRYTIEGTGEWSDYDTDQSGTITLPTISATLRLPKTKTNLKVKSLPKNRMRLTATVKDERPNGYFPTEYADVKLQAFIGGKWITANSGTGFTDSKGIETWLYNRTVRTKARAVTVDDDYKKSISKVVVVPGKG